MPAAVFVTKVYKKTRCFTHKKGLLPQLGSSWPPEQRQDGEHVHQPAVLLVLVSKSQEGTGSDETGEGLWVLIPGTPWRKRGKQNDTLPGVSLVLLHPEAMMWVVQNRYRIPTAMSIHCAPALLSEQMGFSYCCQLDIIIQTQAPDQDASKLLAARSWQDMVRERNIPPCCLFSSQLLCFIILTELPWKDELMSSLETGRSH